MDRDEEHVLTGSTMGAMYTLKYVAPAVAVRDAEIQRRVGQVLERMEQLFSTYRSDSELSRLNRARGGEWVPLPGEVLMLMRSAQDLSVLTGGSFDMTVGPLVALWGFGPARGSMVEVPDAQKIAAAKALAGPGMIELRNLPPAARKQHTDVNVDLNSLVPGYAADRVALQLDTLGVQHYLIDLGGELRLKGRNARNEPWRIAIERPDTGARSVVRSLKLSDVGVSTAGDYRNFFELNGRHYSHIIDARSGWPIEHALASVTVIAATATEADAWDTPLLILGPVDGLALAEKEGIAALFIVKHGGGWVEKATRAFAALEQRQ